MNKLLDQANKRALDYFKCRTDGKGLDQNALAFAIQALEKQVPKKVKEAHFETVCPVCKGSLYIDDLNVVEQSRYCPDCGQMLEWE